MAEAARPARGRRSWVPIGIAVAASIVAFLFSPSGSYLDVSPSGARGPAAFPQLENSWSDYFYWYLKRIGDPALRSGYPKITIAAIDDPTTRELGWPFKRRLHARLIDRLTELGAKVIFFDVLFTTPDRDDPSNDRALIAATRRAGRVIHLATVEGDIQQPIDGLREASRFVAFPNVGPGLDKDGHFRRLPTSTTFDGRVYPSPALAALSIYRGVPLEELLASTPEMIELNFRRETRWTDALTSTYRHVSVADILAGRLRPAERAALRDGIIFIGSTAVGTYDHYPSPFVHSMPGVEFHATGLDNLIHGDHVRRAGVAMFLIVLAAVWLPVLLIQAPPLPSSIGAAAVLLSWRWFCGQRFLGAMRYDFVAPTVLFGACYVAMAVWRMLTEGRQNRLTRQMFSQYLAPEVVEDLVRRGEMPKLGGEKREMTVLFLDIAHFTTISEKMPPEDLIHFLNHYLTALSDIVLKHRGVVDKYIGDCVMAFWNAPIDVPDHRAQACLAAVECIQAVERLNAEPAAKSLPMRPSIRVGLNSGTVVVGNTGSARKLAYTVLGDEVNLASRLEGANKFFGSSIMASESAYEGAKGLVEARLLGSVRVVGKIIPIKVYELLAKKGELSPVWSRALPVYERAVEAFHRREFASAQRLFAEVAAELPEDRPTQLYLAQCQDFLAVPPPSDWDGVFKLNVK